MNGTLARVKQTNVSSILYPVSFQDKEQIYITTTLVCVYVCLYYVSQFALNTLFSSFTRLYNRIIVYPTWYCQCQKFRNYLFFYLLTCQKAPNFPMVYIRIQMRTVSLWNLHKTCWLLWHKRLFFLNYNINKHSTLFPINDSPLTFIMGCRNVKGNFSADDFEHEQRALKFKGSTLCV